jgi:tetratricopeptide (TPR) repeat protein
MIRAPAAIAVAVAVCWAHAARASQERFDRATELMHAGDNGAAAEALVVIADDTPDDPLADDALFEAARLFEERLGDPARALALYERLLDRYGDSRSALAAGRRAEALRRDIGDDGGGAEAVAAFNEIRHRYPERSPAESIAMMEQLLADHPDWPGAVRGVMWLARVHQREGDLARAAARYGEVAERWPDSPETFEALRGAGDVAIARGRLDDAEAYFTALQTGGDPTLERAKHEAFVVLRKERRRARWYWMSFVAIAAALVVLIGSLRHAAGSWRAAGAALRSPPTEAIYFAPVAIVMIIAAATGHQSIAPATAIVLAGGLAVTWLSGAGLARAREPWRVAAHALSAAAAVVAIVYIALHRTRLIDLIAETIRFGPEH